MDKEQLAIARLQDAARLSEHRYKRPLMVTYSGGKDSQVLVALAERAGINFEVVNSHTTADAQRQSISSGTGSKSLKNAG